MPECLTDVGVDEFWDSWANNLPSAKEPSGNCLDDKEVTYPLAAHQTVTSGVSIYYWPVKSLLFKAFSCFFLSVYFVLRTLVWVEYHGSRHRFTLGAKADSLQ